MQQLREVAPDEWDSRLTLDDLATALRGMSSGYDDTEIAEAVFASLRTPNVAFSRERVVALPDGEVIAGAVSLGRAMVEATLAHNPVLFGTLIQDWIDANREANSAAEDAERAYEAELAEHPSVKQAVERAREWASDRGAPRLFVNIALTTRQEQVMRLYLQGDSFREIGAKLGIAHQVVFEHLRTVRARILVSTLTPAAAK